MKRILFLPILMGVMLLAACQTTSEQVFVEQEKSRTCVDDQCKIITYAAANGNDLMLETAKHVIQITAQPGTPYAYYIWAGDKTTSDEPDIVIDNIQQLKK